jgi:hypothetical protein
LVIQAIRQSFEIAKIERRKDLLVNGIKACVGSRSIIEG